MHGLHGNFQTNYCLELGSNMVKEEVPLNLNSILIPLYTL